MSSWMSYMPSFSVSTISPTSVNSSQYTVLSTKTTEILNHLQNAEWSALRKYFSPAIRPLLPPTALSAGWNLILTTAGPFEKVLGNPITSPGRLYTTVKVPLQFQRTKLALNLHMTSSGSLLGLRIIPYSLAGFNDETKQWQSPSYAPASSVREIEAAIGYTRKVGCTLTLPSKSTTGTKYPCRVLIAGSGPCDRDSTVGPNKPFRDMAWGFAAKNVASMRFDKAMYRSALVQLRYLASLDDDASEDTPLWKQIRDLEKQSDVADRPDLNISTPAKDLPFGIGAAYWLSCRSIDPVGTVKRLRKPILLLQGAMDYQVTIADDYEKWVAELEQQKGVEFKVYAKLNHLFIAGQGPSTPAEYEVPGNVDGQVVQDIGDWVKKCCRGQHSPGVG